MPKKSVAIKDGGSGGGLGAPTGTRKSSRRAGASQRYFSGGADEPNGAESDRPLANSGNLADGTAKRLSSDNDNVSKKSSLLGTFPSSSSSPSGPDGGDANRSGAGGGGGDPFSPGGPNPGGGSKSRKGGGKSKGKAKKPKALANLGKRQEKYTRPGGANDVRKVSDKKLQAKLRRQEKANREALETVTRAEILDTGEAGYVEPEGPMERTYRVSQAEIRRSVDVAAAAKGFDLNLEELGPYRAAFSRNGNHMLIGGAKGHLAMFDWRSTRLLAEVQVKETVRDVAFLHDHTMWAAAQRRHVYIYDDNGLEVHCLTTHTAVQRMAFLPYHYLLVTVNDRGELVYQDTSTGSMVAEFKTKLGSCNVMRPSPYNAIVHCGHYNGTVTLWSPNSSAPLVRMLTHKGPVTALAFDATGHRMVTCGMDRQVKVWDIRMYKELHAYFSRAPVTSCDVSATGVLATGFGSTVQTWKDGLASKQRSPYLVDRGLSGRRIESLAFCPHDDILAVGNSGGVKSMIVPGAGMTAFDASLGSLADPTQNAHRRKEMLVRSLLEKVQPSMITLDPRAVAAVDRAPAEVISRERRAAKEANEAARRKAGLENLSKKTRGKRPDRKQRLKEANIVDKKREAIREAARKREIEERNRKAMGNKEKGALSRFFNKTVK